MMAMTGLGRGYSNFEQPREQCARCDEQLEDHVTACLHCDELADFCECVEFEPVPFSLCRDGEGTYERLERP